LGGSFAKGLGDTGISSGSANTAKNWSPDVAEPVSDQFLGTDYQSQSQDPEPGAALSDWFGSNSGSWTP
jgi:hypothetical protein